VGRIRDEMYERFMKLVENQADELAKNIVEEIRKKHEYAHYQELPEDVFAERISQILRNVYVRLGNWLNEDKPKNTLFAYYSDLGAQRFREGIPLDEVIRLFLLVKREIWHVFREEMAVNSEMDLKRLMELDYYVNLFFDRIVSSTISGYQNELWESIGRHREHRHLKVKGA
jgi:hypothetical protein